MLIFVFALFCAMCTCCSYHGSWAGGTKQVVAPPDPVDGRHILLLAFPPSVDASPFLADSPSIAKKFALESRICEEACAFVTSQGAGENETVCSMVLVERQLNSEADDEAFASCARDILDTGELANASVSAIVASRATSFAADLLVDDLGIPVFPVDTTIDGIACTLAVAANMLGLRDVAILAAGSEGVYPTTDTFTSSFAGTVSVTRQITLNGFLARTAASDAALLALLTELTVVHGVRAIVFICFHRDEQSCSRLYPQLDLLPPRVRDNLVVLGSDGLWDQPAERWGRHTPQGVIAVDEGGVDPFSAEWNLLRWKLADMPADLMQRDLASASAVFRRAVDAARDVTWNGQAVGNVVQFAGGQMEWVAVVDLLNEGDASSLGVCGTVRHQRTTLPVPLPQGGRTRVPFRLSAPLGAESTTGDWLARACAAVDDTSCCALGCGVDNDGGGVDPASLVTTDGMANLLAAAAAIIRRRVGLLDLPVHIAVAPEDEAAADLAAALRARLPDASATPGDARLGFILASTPATVTVLLLELRTAGAFTMYSHWLATPSLALTPVSRSNAGLLALEPWPGLPGQLAVAVNATRPPVDEEGMVRVVWADSDGVWQRRSLSNVPAVGVAEQGGSSDDASSSLPTFSLVAAGPPLAEVDARVVCAPLTYSAWFVDWTCATRSTEADVALGTAAGQHANTTIFLHWYDELVTGTGAFVAVTARRKAEANALVAERLDVDAGEVQVQLCPLGPAACTTNVVPTVVAIAAMVDEEVAARRGNVSASEVATAVQARLDEGPYGFIVYNAEDRSILASWSTAGGWDDRSRPTMHTTEALVLAVVASVIVAASVGAIGTHVLEGGREAGGRRARRVTGVELQGVASPVPGSVLTAGDIRLHPTPIGSGHFGLVQKGVMARSGLQVAVKQLKHVANTSSTEYHRACDGFLTELQILAFLPPHPNIVQLVGWTQGDTLPDVWIVLRLCKNASVDRWMVAQSSNGRTVSWLRRLDLLLGIVEGLATVHRSLVVHRDLALRNVLLDVDQNGTLVPKLTDFGMARTILSVSTVFPGTDGFGAVRWMAPEALSGDRSYGAPADMWAVGVCVYELVTNCAGDPYGSSFDPAAVRDGTLVLALPTVLAAADGADEESARSSLESAFASCIVHDWRDRVSAQTMVTRIRPTVKRVQRARTRADDHSPAQGDTKTGRSRRSSTSSAQSGRSRHSRHQYHDPATLA